MDKDCVVDIGLRMQLTIQVINSSNSIDEISIAIDDIIDIGCNSRSNRCISCFSDKVSCSSSSSGICSGNICQFSHFVAQIVLSVQAINVGKSTKAESTKNNNGQDNIHIKILSLRNSRSVTSIQV